MEPPLKKIKLMCDYSSDPIWNNDPNDSYCGGNMDFEDLPISAELHDRLRQWADMYESKDDWTDVIRHDSTWTPDFEAQFEKIGRQLWLLLRDELGPKREISYFSEQMRRLVSDPAELDDLNEVPSDVAPSPPSVPVDQGKPWKVVVTLRREPSDRSGN